jgi:Arc/MetJ-type ribon-helix-helix transcriptional regulator
VAKLTTEIPSDLSRQIDRIIRDGWFPDQESVVREALSQFVDAKSFLGDSPRMLHRFAADALNDSKPEVALKFVSRALSLMVGQDITDFTCRSSSSSAAMKRRSHPPRKRKRSSRTTPRWRGGSRSSPRTGLGGIEN